MKDGKVVRNVFYGIEMSKEEKELLLELTKKFDDKMLELKPRYWSMNDTLRYLSCKRYDLDSAKKAILEHWTWIQNIKKKGINLTPRSAEMMVSSPNTPPKVPPPLQNPNLLTFFS